MSDQIHVPDTAEDLLQHDGGDPLCDLVSVHGACPENATHSVRMQLDCGHWNVVLTCHGCRDLLQAHPVYAVRCRDWRPL